MKPADLDLGLLSRAEVLDKAVAEAAFALAKDAVSAPVAGDFGPSLVRVTDIQAEQVRPFEQVAAELRTELAVAAARTQLRDIHDKIEEMRANAKPLSEIAQTRACPCAALNWTGRRKSAAASPPQRDRAGAICPLGLRLRYRRRQ